MGVVAEATSPTPLFTARRLRFALLDPILEIGQGSSLAEVILQTLSPREDATPGGIGPRHRQIMRLGVVADLEVPRRSESGNRDTFDARLNGLVALGRLGGELGGHGRKSHQRENECTHFVTSRFVGCAFATARYSRCRRAVFMLINTLRQH